MVLSRVDGSSVRTITTTVVHGAEAVREVAEAWAGCELRSPFPKFQHHPAHVLWAALDRPGRDLLTVLAWEDGELVAVAPFLLVTAVVAWRVRGLRRRRTVFRFRTRQAQLLGETFSGADDAVVHRALLDASLDALGALGDIDVVELRHLSCETELWRLLGARAAAAKGWSTWCPGGPIDKLLVDIPSDYDRFLAERLGRKARANVRREHRRLAAARPGGVRLQVVRRPEEVEEFLPLAAGVFDRSWHHGTGAQTLVADQRRADQLRFMAEQGWLRSYLLWVGDEPVAMSVAYESYGTVLLSRLAHDRTWDPWSPGKVMLHRILADLCEDPEVHTLDFGYGDWAYKRQVATRRRPAGDVLLVSRRARSQAVFAGPRAWSAVRRGATSALDRVGVLDDVLVWTRKRLPR